MTTPHPIRKPHQEHSVPWFWPFAAAIELGEEGMRLFQHNVAFLAQAHLINAPPMPEWATPNRIDLELNTMRLRDFSRDGSRAISTPVLIDPPYAGHDSSLADYAKGQSLVETLRAAGHDRIFVMDWKSATPEMKDYDIDTYLAEINVVVDGARACSAYGSEVAAQLARTLTQAGAVVISGLARGIDAQAHRGALEAGANSGGARLRDRPRLSARARDAGCRDRGDGGLIVSEYAPGVEPAPWRFPARNRIVAGLAGRDGGGRGAGAKRRADHRRPRARRGTRGARGAGRDHKPAVERDESPPAARRGSGHLCRRRARRARPRSGLRTAASRQHGARTTSRTGTSRRGRWSRSGPTNSRGESV